VTAAKKAGVETIRLRKLHRAGRLVRVATGAYADASAFDNCEPWTRHRLRVRGVGMTAPADTYATGWSAAAMFEFRTLGDPPALPQMIRPSQASRRSFTSAHVHIAVAHVPNDHLLWFPDDAMGIVSPALAVVDLARHAPIPAALVVADDVARREPEPRRILPTTHASTLTTRSPACRRGLACTAVGSSSPTPIQGPNPSWKRWAGSPACRPTCHCSLQRLHTDGRRSVVPARSPVAVALGCGRG
jgi:hypothetical protein